MLGNLGDADPKLRVSSALYFESRHNDQLSDLARIAGVSDCSATVEQLKEEGELIELKISPQRNLLTHRLTIENIGNSIIKFMKRFHESDPLASGVGRIPLEAFFGFLDTKLLFEFALKTTDQRQESYSGRLSLLAGRLWSSAYKE